MPEISVDFPEDAASKPSMLAKKPAPGLWVFGFTALSI